MKRMARPPALFEAISGVTRYRVFFPRPDRLRSLKWTIAVPTAVPIKAPARASDVPVSVLIDAGHADQRSDPVGGDADRKLVVMRGDDGGHREGLGGLARRE